MTTPVHLPSTRLSALGIPEPRADLLCLLPESPDRSALSIQRRRSSAPYCASGAADHADPRRLLPVFTATRRAGAGQIPIAHRSL